MTTLNEDIGFEKQLDDIFEDLIVGHNFNYARKAILELVHQYDEARDKSLLKRVADYANGMKLDTILVNTQYSSDSVEMHEAAARNEALMEVVTFIDKLNPDKTHA